MMLLITDGAPRSKNVEDKVIHTIQKEVNLFKKEYKETSFKLLALMLGNDSKTAEFIEKLTHVTVKATR